MTESRRFSRVRESFDCLVCGLRVEGDGYTNHCPRCLASRHVDVHPGDRAAGCGGVMNPVRTKRESRRGWMILHRCERCGHEKWNRAADDDDLEEIAHLA